MSNLLASFKRASRHDVNVARDIDSTRGMLGWHDFDTSHLEWYKFSYDPATNFIEILPGSLQNGCLIGRVLKHRLESGKPSLLTVTKGPPHHHDNRLPLVAVTVADVARYNKSINSLLVRIWVGELDPFEAATETEMITTATGNPDSNIIGNKFKANESKGMDDLEPSVKLRDDPIERYTDLVDNLMRNSVPSKSDLSELREHLLQVSELELKIATPEALECLDDTHESFTDTIDKLMSSIKQFDQIRKQMRREDEDIQRRIAEIEKDNPEMRENATETLRRFKEKIQQFPSLNLGLSQLDQELADTKRERDEARNERDEAKRDFLSMEADFAEATAARVNAEAERDEALAKHGRAQADLTQANIDCVDAELQGDLAQGVRNVAQDQRDQAKRDCENARQRADEARKEYNVWKDLFQQATKERDEARSKLNAAPNERVKSKNDDSGLSKQAQATISKAKRAASEATKARNEAQCHSVELQEQISRLQRDLAQTKRGRDRAKDSHIEAMGERSLWQRDCKDARVQRDTAREECDQVKRSLVKAETQLMEAITARAAAELERDEANKECDEVRRERDEARTQLINAKTVSIEPYDKLSENGDDSEMQMLTRLLEKGLTYYRHSRDMIKEEYPSSTSNAAGSKASETSAPNGAASVSIADPVDPTRVPIETDTHCPSPPSNMPTSTSPLYQWTSDAQKIPGTSPTSLPRPFPRPLSPLFHPVFSVAASDPLHSAPLRLYQPGHDPSRHHRYPHTSLCTDPSHFSNSPPFEFYTSPFTHVPPPPRHPQIPPPSLSYHPYPAPTTSQANAFAHSSASPFDHAFPTPYASSYPYSVPPPPTMPFYRLPPVLSPPAPRPLAAPVPGPVGGPIVPSDSPATPLSISLKVGSGPQISFTVPSYETTNAKPTPMFNFGHPPIVSMPSAPPATWATPFNPPSWAKTTPAPAVAVSPTPQATASTPIATPTPTPSPSKRNTATTATATATTAADAEKTEGHKAARLESLQKEMYALEGLNEHGMRPWPQEWPVYWEGAGLGEGSC